MYNKRELKKTDRKQDKRNPFSRDMIYDPRGQWDNPGENTRILGGNITMQGVPYQTYGVPYFNDGTKGQGVMMQPGQDYIFKDKNGKLAKYVDEFPKTQQQPSHQMPDGTWMPGEEHEELDLTEEEIAEYRAGGYVVEEYHEGGAVHNKSPHPHAPYDPILDNPAYAPAVSDNTQPHNYYPAPKIPKVTLPNFLTDKVFPITANTNTKKYPKSTFIEKDNSKIKRFVDENKRYLGQVYGDDLYNEDGSYNYKKLASTNDLGKIVEDAKYAEFSKNEQEAYDAAPFYEKAANAVTATMADPMLTIRNAIFEGKGPMMGQWKGLNDEGNENERFYKNATGYDDDWLNSAVNFINPLAYTGDAALADNSFDAGLNLATALSMGSLSGLTRPLASTLLKAEEKVVNTVLKTPSLKALKQTPLERLDNPELWKTYMGSKSGGIRGAVAKKAKQLESRYLERVLRKQNNKRVSRLRNSSDYKHDEFMKQIKEAQYKRSKLNDKYEAFRRNYSGLPIEPTKMAGGQGRIYKNLLDESEYIKLGLFPGKVDDLENLIDVGRKLNIKPGMENVAFPTKATVINPITNWNNRSIFTTQHMPKLPGSVDSGNVEQTADLLKQIRKLDKKGVGVDYQGQGNIMFDSATGKYQLVDLNYVGKPAGRSKRSREGTQEFFDFNKLEQTPKERLANKFGQKLLDEANEFEKLRLMVPGKSYKFDDGGEVLDLTDLEISEYEKSGYVVEELPKAQDGIIKNGEITAGPEFNTHHGVIGNLGIKNRFHTKRDPKTYHELAANIYGGVNNSKVFPGLNASYEFGSNQGTHENFFKTEVGGDAVRGMYFDVRGGSKLPIVNNRENDFSVAPYLGGVGQSKPYNTVYTEDGSYDQSKTGLMGGVGLNYLHKKSGFGANADAYIRTISDNDQNENTMDRLLFGVDAKLKLYKKFKNDPYRKQKKKIKDEKERQKNRSTFKFEDGGSIMDLNEFEIAQYKKGGYIVEDMPVNSLIEDPIKNPKSNQNETWKATIDWLNANPYQEMPKWKKLQEIKSSNYPNMNALGRMRLPNSGINVYPYTEDGKGYMYQQAEIGEDYKGLNIVMINGKPVVVPPADASSKLKKEYGNFNKEYLHIMEKPSLGRNETFHVYGKGTPYKNDGGSIPSYHNGGEGPGHPHPRKQVVDKYGIPIKGPVRRSAGDFIPKEEVFEWESAPKERVVKSAPSKAQKLFDEEFPVTGPGTLESLEIKAAEQTDKTIKHLEKEGVPIDENTREDLYQETLDNSIRFHENENAFGQVSKKKEQSSWDAGVERVTDMVTNLPAAAKYSFVGGGLDNMPRNYNQMLYAERDAPTYAFTRNNDGTISRSPQAIESINPGAASFQERFGYGDEGMGEGSNPLDFVNDMANPTKWASLLDNALSKGNYGDAAIEAAALFPLFKIASLLNKGKNIAKKGLEGASIAWKTHRPVTKLKHINKHNIEKQLGKEWNIRPLGFNINKLDDVAMEVLFKKNTGAYNEGIFDLKNPKFKNQLVKFENPELIAYEQYMNDYPTVNFPELMKNIPDEGTFAKIKRQIDFSTGKRKGQRALIMDRLSGESAKKLPIDTWMGMEVETLAELQKNLQKLRSENLGVDWAGDNILFDTDKQKFNMIDIIPHQPVDINKLGVGASNWQDNVFGSGNPYIYDNAGQNINSTMRNNLQLKVNEAAHKAGMSERDQSFIWEEFQKKLDQLSNDIDFKKNGGQYVDVELTMQEIKNLRDGGLVVEEF